MRRILYTALLFLLIPAALCADFSYKLELFSFDPIYKEYAADKNKPMLALSPAYYTDGFPTYILQDDWTGDGYVIEEYPLTEAFAGAPMMIEINLSETISVLRQTFTFDHWHSAPSPSTSPGRGLSTCTWKVSSQIRSATMECTSMA